MFCTKGPTLLMLGTDGVSTGKTSIVGVLVVEAPLDQLFPRVGSIGQNIQVARGGCKIVVIVVLIVLLP